ncbi:hypothetical protein ACFRKD_32210 [Streptomyces niveus]|uniref:hypothetical protein n=1 Tax=Streptomyces niveus TaxID=193462 RepID=UPI0036C0B2A3
MSIDPKPHQAYISAVAAAAGVDIHHAPGAPRHVVAYPQAHGLLTAALHYSQQDGGPDALPDGVTLRWDQRAGWRYVPGGRPDAPETPLPVPVLAAPDALAGLLPELLAGHTAGLAHSTAQWPLTDNCRRLLGRRDVVEALEALTDEGEEWEHIEEAGEPVALACGSVVWRLTDDHLDPWYGGDWRDSRLSGIYWSNTVSARTPGDVIVAAARAAVAHARTPVPA